MGEDELDLSMDTPSLDDVSSDVSGSGGASGSFDVGSLMDEVSAAPMDGFDDAAIDSSPETFDLPADEPGGIDGLMDAAADDLDADSLEPADLPGDLDDGIQDSGSDIADLMDEATIEPMNDAAPPDTAESPDGDLDGAMDDAPETPDVLLEIDDAPADGPDVETLMEDDLPAETEDAADLPADVPDVPQEEMAEVSDLLDETEVDEPTDAAEEVTDIPADVPDVAQEETAEVSDLLDETEPDAPADTAEPYKAVLNSEIPILKEDETVDSLENVMNDLNEGEGDIPTDTAEPYKAVPNSEIPILKEDETVDSLENVMNDLNEGESDSPADVTPEILADNAPDLPHDLAPDVMGGENPESRIEELEAQKAELLAMKEQLLAYKQEHADYPDESDEGALVKVLKKDGTDTSVIHHDYEAELADLDDGITNWQKIQEEWASDLNEELKQINENPDLSESERMDLLKEHYAKRDVYAKEYDKEYAELKEARDELLKKAGKDTLNKTETLEPKKETLEPNKETTDVPKLEDISDWIEDINPKYDPFDWESPYSNNCGSCAFAVEQRLDGNESIAATSENIGTIEEMNKATGMEQVAMSPNEIKDYLISQGPGSHGIVGIDRVSGPGHWFNAYYDGKKVVAIDGQTGEINDWPPDYGDVKNWDISVRKEKL